MNIFEDLIDELKEANLLEETVIELNSENGENKSSEHLSAKENLTATKNADSLEPEKFPQQSFQPNNSSVAENNTKSAELTAKDSRSEKQTANSAEESPLKESEFFRKRAVNEVAFLQMVEHVFAGVEREQMKLPPKPYDTLKVKQVLHNFLQISKEGDASEQAQVEFQLLQETENWYSTLTHRDKRISINHLRRYCETARPSLSTPALVSLSRFYRNSPYSEQVRGKFDFVVTRLFSVDAANEQREMKLEREELIPHVKELYADWSSIPLYPGEDDSSILLIALRFEDFITEAAVAENFDELIKNDFFNRLRLFKKDTNENFLSPLIVAADVESNIKIGNRYVELLEKERAKKSLFEDKYGFLHDQSISDATGKTFQLVELLSRKIEKPKPLETPQTVEVSPTRQKENKAEKKSAVETKKESKIQKDQKPAADKLKSAAKSAKHETIRETKTFFGLNSWILTAIIFAVILTVGIYLWSNAGNSEAKEVAGVKIVNLENSSLRENIDKASIKSEIFTATVLPNWNALAQNKKEELLKKILSIGGDKGFKNVQLLSAEGKIVGSASNEKVEVYNP